MQGTARILVPAAFGGGVVVAAVAAVALWLQAGPASAPVVPAPAAPHGEAPAAPDTSEALAAITAELARVQAGNTAWEQRTGALQRELHALRTRLTQVDQAQATLGQDLTQRAAAAPAAPPAPAPDPQARTPADEAERADARVQAQVEVLEDTVRTDGARGGAGRAAAGGGHMRHDALPAGPHQHGRRIPGRQAPDPPASGPLAGAGVLSRG